jgi:carbamoylphosphate synthase large subunit
MKNYTVALVGSGEVSEIHAANDREATQIALDKIGGGVAAENWDIAGYNDDYEEVERLLLWESAEDAANDDGSKAVAHLTVIR